MTILPEALSVEWVGSDDAVIISGAEASTTTIEVTVDPGLDLEAMAVVVDPGPGIETAFVDGSVSIDVEEPFASRFDETNPVFTYSGGVLTRIDYASGNVKTFTWTAGVLTKVDYVANGGTIRKTFSYNSDGSLAAISEEAV